MTSDTFVSIRTGEAAEVAGAIWLCNVLVLSTAPSLRHGPCGPRGSTVHPGMLTETQAFPRMLPESDRSGFLTGQLTCKLCLGPHPERLSDELVPEKSHYETRAGQKYPHIKDDLAQCVQLMVIRGRSSK